MSTTGGTAYLASFVSACISDRQKSLKDLKVKNGTGPPDFLTKFITAYEVNPQKMTTGDLKSICHSNVRAGGHTTSITISAVIYYLLKYPATFDQLRKEIDDAAAAGKVSDPVSFKEAQDLVYLQAVIKEALRLHPAAGLPFMHLVPTATTIAGKHFPAKATVGISAWVAHRDPSVYGSDADYWRPERWLEIEQEVRVGEVEKYFFAWVKEVERASERTSACSRCQS